MARRRSDADDDEPSDSGDDAPGRPRDRKRRRARRGALAPMKSWDAEEPDETETDEDEERAPIGSGGRRPVFFRARDSLYFEPLVALAVVLLLLVGLYAYTQNWPPLYVVESSSMQHGTGDTLGLLNTGDIVLAQRTQAGSVTTYVEGIASGYSTYGEYGDVVLYQPNGLPGTPIIHRAIVFIQANSDGTRSVPSLQGLPCGSMTNAVYRSSAAGGCAWSHISGTLTLYHIGWRSLTVSTDLNGLGPSDGFVTLGDNNQISDQDGGLSTLVQPGWLVGVARGMIPWFGAIKLGLQGNAAEVPAASWQFMGITIIALIAAAFGVHYLLRAEGVEDPRRKQQEAEERAARADDEGEEEVHPRWRGLRGWRSDADHDEAEDDRSDETPKHRTGGHDRSPHGGRPRPSVRGHGGRRGPEDDSESAS
ncbi:MAG TPA: S26 family signal peptidase [Thermoplasmata archaeon]|nr:S26 family signal peptidase [Thermoplasmata archaeon]